MSQASLQLDAKDIPDESWDVIVIGAGPAGSICALWLARSKAFDYLYDTDDIYGRMLT